MGTQTVKPNLKFQQKLNEVKFADFQPLSQTMVDGLDKCLNVEFPRLMDQLPSEKDAPDVLRKKGAMTAQDPGMVPVPSTNLKFGSKKPAMPSFPSLMP